MKKCGRCKEEMYCSKKCQTFGWKKLGHRKSCRGRQPNSPRSECSLFFSSNDYLGNVRSPPPSPNPRKSVPHLLRAVRPAKASRARTSHHHINLIQLCSRLYRAHTLNVCLIAGLDGQGRILDTRSHPRRPQIASKESLRKLPGYTQDIVLFGIICATGSYNFDELLFWDGI